MKSLPALTAMAQLSVTSATATAPPELPFDLIDPILMYTLRLSFSPAHPDRVHQCLCISPPSTQILRAALQWLGYPSATTLARNGDIFGLELLLRFKQLEPTKSAGLFWHAVAYDKVEVLDWWTSTKEWPVPSQGGDDVAVCGNPYPVSEAIARRSTAAIDWLIDHPDLVHHVCAADPTTKVGAIKEACVADMLVNGMRKQALRWIDARYHILAGESSVAGMTTAKFANGKKVKWLSPLMQVVSEHGLTNVLDALEAAGDTYVGILGSSTRLVLMHAVQVPQLDMLEWWFDPKRTRTLFADALFDFVAWVCESRSPIEVLEWYKAKHTTGALASKLPLKYDSASAQGNVAVMDWLLRSDLPVSYTSNAMDFASQQGAVASLEWWRTSGLPLKYTEAALDQAPNAQVLEWWLNSGLELKYTIKALHFARNLKVFDWWKTRHNERGLELKYTSDLLDRASAEEDFVILNWWHESGLKMKAKRALITAFAASKHQVVQWWMTNADAELLNELAVETWAESFRDARHLHWCEHSRLPVPNDPRIIDECGNAESLRWWAERFDKLPFTYTERALAKASESGRVDLLDWWDQSGLELLYNETAMDLASSRGMADVLEWWFLSGLDLEYSEAAVDEASANGHVKALTWWLNSGVDLKYNEAALDKASINGHVKVLKWWVRSGLPLKYSYKAVEALYSPRERTLQSDETLRWWNESGLVLPSKSTQ
ncbi:hypothetical protein BCR44DRAFT_1432506 [Catenaria anguillulae PL171]|uniref:Ankyrin repeat-containing domain protein n=1 Tax=Catenaria anguillulae PL171 TaxID=765915 RepID=A0A1Y2HR98_9FUNG|nr:hypothetical protein BCR44DRAFT_1432506 [Catenaria anguillulae PL171]